MQYIIGFFNPVIPTQDFELFHNPDSYFWHPTSLVIFQSRIAPWFCFKIPNPELQIREISDPGNLIMTLYTIVHFSWLTNVAAPVTQQVVNCWTESSLSLMILLQQSSKCNDTLFTADKQMWNWLCHRHNSQRSIFNNYSTSTLWIWVCYNHLISNKREWNNCFIKDAHKISRILPDFICKTADIQLVFNFEQTRIVTKFGENGVMAHIPWWLSQSEL